MKVLVDTNVFVRLARRNDPQTEVADKALQRLEEQGHDVRVVPQVLYEYWVVATRTIENNGLGFATDVVDADVERIKSLFQVLRDERGILDPWQELVRRYSCQGKQAHDARLVAAMQRHGLTHILTFNSRDFQRYTEVTILDPQEVASE